jgi:hypothetical protein
MLALAERLEEPERGEMTIILPQLAPLSHLGDSRAARLQITPEPTGPGRSEIDNRTPLVDRSPTHECQPSGALRTPVNKPGVAVSSRM